MFVFLYYNSSLALLFALCATLRWRYLGDGSLLTTHSLDADDTDDTDLFFLAFHPFVMLTIPLSFILCHAELGSASVYWILQILNQRSTPEGAKVKQVIRYAHRKSYLIS